MPIIIETRKNVTTLPIVMANCSQSREFSCGFIGEVCSVKEKTLIVRIAEKTQVEVVKSAVAQIIEQGETPEDVKA